MKLQHAVAGMFLLMFFLLAGGAALHESATVDEIAHIGAATSYVQKLDLRLNEEHPPLSKVIAGIPLALRHSAADYNGTAWRQSESFLPGYFLQWVFGDSLVGRWNDWRGTLVWARFPMLLLSVWLGWMIYVYATRVSDAAGGLLCLAVYCSMPTFLVFGPLVLSDVPVTLFTLMALWGLGDLWSTPSRRNSVLFAIAFAAALLSKFTGLLIFAVIFTLFVKTRFWPSSAEPTEIVERKTWRRLRWRAIWKGALWALAIVYVFYFVFSIRQPDSALDRIGSTQIWAHVLRRLLMPPWLYVRGLVLMVAMGSRSTFLLGRSYAHGVPFYFPVVFALKSPLGFLLLLVLAATLRFVALRTRSVSFLNRRAVPHWHVLMAGFWVFLIVCLLSRLDISIRHFMVPIVLLILLLAPLPRMAGALAKPLPVQLLIGGLVLSCYVAVLPAYPYFFPFINSLGLGKPAYKLVNDSNVDWNQSLPDVESFAEAHNMKEVKLDWLALADASLVAPRVRPWDCQVPGRADAGQWVVVAAPMILEERNCGWLENYPHEPIAHGGMYAFHLPNPIPAEGNAEGPPLAKDRKGFFGVSMDIRGMVLNLERHPDQIIPEMEAMAKQYQQRAGKKP